MSHKNYRSWLHGCKLRVWKKLYGSRINVDGVGYPIDKYTKLIAAHKKMKIGSEIYNIYLDKFEKVKEIRCWWHSIDGLKSARWLEIYFITETDYVIYDLNDIYYRPKETTT